MTCHMDLDSFTLIIITTYKPYSRRERLSVRTQSLLKPLAIIIVEASNNPNSMDMEPLKKGTMSSLDTFRMDQLTAKVKSTLAMVEFILDSSKTAKCRVKER